MASHLLNISDGHILEVPNIASTIRMKATPYPCPVSGRIIAHNNCYARGLEAGAKSAAAGVLALDNYPERYSELREFEKDDSSCLDFLQRCRN
jgi:hypothetical protein